MAIRRQEHVIEGVERMAGAAMRKAGGAYRKGVSAPMIEAINGARGFDELRRRLGATLAKRMDATAVETALADALVQAGAIGAAAASPTARQEAGGRGQE